mmetsp:Transcript_47687/g.102131  ORF Transcript_47687/g.102131 Transcript_47687/m.102131 type:complete len:520 (+) Transcript_47687:675-2234(+)
MEFRSSCTSETALVMASTFSPVASRSARAWRTSARSWLLLSWAALSSLTNVDDDIAGAGGAAADPSTFEVSSASCNALHSNSNCAVRASDASALAPAVAEASSSLARSWSVLRLACSHSFFSLATLASLSLRRRLFCGKAWTVSRLANAAATAACAASAAKTSSATCARQAARRFCRSSASASAASVISRANASASSAAASTAANASAPRWCCSSSITRVAAAALANSKVRTTALSGSALRPSASRATDSASAASVPRAATLARTSPRHAAAFSPRAISAAPTSVPTSQVKRAGPVEGALAAKAWRPSAMRRTSAAQRSAEATTLMLASARGATSAAEAQAPVDAMAPSPALPGTVLHGALPPPAGLPGAGLPPAGLLGELPLSLASSPTASTSAGSGAAALSPAAAENENVRKPSESESESSEARSAQATRLLPIILGEAGAVEAATAWSRCVPEAALLRATCALPAQGLGGVMLSSAIGGVLPSNRVRSGRARLVGGVRHDWLASAGALRGTQGIPP